MAYTKMLIIIALLVAVAVFIAVVTATIKPTPHKIITYTAIVEDKVVEKMGSGKYSYGVTLCVYMDHKGVRHTFSERDRYSEEACLLPIGSEVTVTYDETWDRVTNVKPINVELKEK